MIKKLFSVVLIAGTLSVNAQYTKLVDFALTTNGAEPLGSLIQASDGMLYGMTGYGGANTYGVIFQYNPATNTLIDKYDFNNANGGNPQGSLMQATDGMLYGTTSNGGANFDGVIFQYNPVTNVYTKKFDFATGTGYGAGSLMQASDGMLYGMAGGGGANACACGVIFQYNPATNTYIDKIDFTLTNGGFPFSSGSLMQASDGMIYGMTHDGGANTYGVLFQYNPATNTLIDKYDFDGATTGKNPTGSLIQASDGMLYGMTLNGGGIGVGTLFQYNLTTGISAVISFHGTNGQNPYGNLMQASDGMLYGMTFNGGASTNCSGYGCGTLFQYNPTTNTYNDKLDFAGTTNGANPHGSLMQASDGMLYGMTQYGGTSTNCGSNGCGTLFKYGGAAGINQITNSNEVAVYPNPASTSINVTLRQAQGTNANLQITDMLGNTVKQSTIKTEKISIDVADLAEGVYNLSLISNEGVINKRVVITK